MVIIACANIGLRGTTGDFDLEEINGVNESVRSAWRNVNDRLMAVRQKWNVRPSLLGIQEDGGYAYDPEPWFGAPICDDYHIDVGTQGQGRNGVSIYSHGLPFCQKIDPIDDFNEIATVIFDFPNRRSLVKRAAYINFYRNNHKDYPRSVNETVRALKAVIADLRQNHNIQKIIVQGDFNDESKVSLGNSFREITHRKLYHKHNSVSRKRFIDKIWTNFEDCGILDVFNTAENKDQDFGHKFITLWVGKKPNLPPRKQINRVNFKLLKNNVRGSDPGFEIDTIPKNKADIDTLLKDFMSRMQYLVNKSTKLVHVKKKCTESALLSRVDQAEEDILHGKKPIKHLYNHANSIRKGLEDLEDTTKPSLEQLGKKLEDKLARLHEADHEMGRTVINEMFGSGPGIRAKRWGDTNEFLKICNQASNSKAVDSQGFSLQITKVLLSNRAICRRYERIVRCCLEIGYFPENWKSDNIHFIYKGKGQRESAANWRPITIASSFGKHFEKVISFVISGLDDKNYDNHAYVSGKATLTAITATQKALLDDRLRASGIDLRGKKVIHAASADDISGAFESVDHLLLGYALELIFKIESGFKIKEVIMSYLNRHANVVGDDNEDSYSLANRTLRSIPQGSILSPLLWRIFDGIFTQSYKNAFPLIYENFEEVMAITHISYADDHVSIFSIIVDATESNEDIGRRLSRIFDMLREILKAATNTMGSDINPIKSESIVKLELAEFIILENVTEKPPSNKFKWLGYDLTLTDDYRLEFDAAKIKAKINSIMNIRSKFMQFTSKIGIRWRLYTVFISPFIELYLPLVIQESHSAQTTTVHNLQHRSVCAALGLPWTAGRRELEIKLGLKSVEEKAQRLATRLIRSCNLTRPVFYENTVTTRSGNVNWTPANKTNRAHFITRLFVVQENPVETTPKIKFIARDVKTWVGRLKLRIKNRINRRRVG